jgi:hypothetical protein
MAHRVGAHPQGIGAAASMNQGRAVNIAFVLLLHLALLWAFTRPLAQRVRYDERVWIHWLAPVAPRPQEIAAPRRRTAVRQPVTPPAGRLSAQREPAPAAAAQDSAAAAPPAVAEPPRDDHALFAESPAPGKLPPDVMQQALKSIGDIDRQLRAENPQALSAPANSLNARLAKGIAAAHAAVKPKWFEPARIELISPPNDPNRIYRVTTALGDYCLYYADKNSAIGSAKSGQVGFGQPKAAPCPIPF